MGRRFNWRSSIVQTEEKGYIVSRREEIIRLLEDNNVSALQELGRRDSGIFRTLISLAYDKQQILSWRAIEAVGFIAGQIAETNYDKIRNLAQRLLWMLREESGNNPWSAPDMLGEIVRNAPERFSDIAPIISSFHEEEILHTGVLRAMFRIAEVRPSLVADQVGIAYEYLNCKDALARAYAALLIGRLKPEGYREALEPLLHDNDEAVLYEDSGFRTCRIRDLVSEILNNA